MRWHSRRSIEPLGPAERPAADEAEASRVVLAGVVPLWQAPMLLAGLADLDIVGTFAEQSSRRMLFGAPATARVYVFDRDLAVAQRFLAEMAAVTPER